MGKLLENIIRRNVRKAIREAVQDHGALQQYLYWVNGLGEKGTIKSSYHSKESFLKSFDMNRLYDIGYNGNFSAGYLVEFDDDAYREYVDHNILCDERYGERYFDDPENLELNEEGDELLRRMLVESGYEIVKWYLDNYVNDQGLMYIERSIDIPENGKKGGSSLYSYLSNNLWGLGMYWAYGKGNSEAYCGNGGMSIVLQGYIRMEDVDYGLTCGLESAEESEVKFDGDVMLTGIVAEGRPVRISPRIICT